MRNYSKAEKNAILKVAKMRKASSRVKAWDKLSERTGRNVDSLKRASYYLKHYYGKKKKTAESNKVVAPKVKVRPIKIDGMTFEISGNTLTINNNKINW